MERTCHNSHGGPEVRNDRSELQYYLVLGQEQDANRGKAYANPKTERIARKKREAIPQTPGGGEEVAV